MDSAQSPNDSQAELTPVSESNAHDVARIAADYRQLVLWVFVELLFSFAIQFVPLFVVFLVFAGGGIMFYAYRLAKALGSSVPLLWPIGMLIPIINILGLLTLSSKASHVCRENGIEVGLLGPQVP